MCERQQAGQGRKSLGLRTFGPATAEILPESEVSAVRSLIMRKYRADLVIFRPLRFAQGVPHLGRPRTTPVILAITPS